MRESVIYQEILKEGEFKGRLEGKLEGKLEGLREGKLEGKLEGLREGKIEAQDEIALNLLETGMSLEKISQVTGLSLDRVQVLANSQSESNN